MKKNIIFGSLMLALVVGVSPVSADGGMSVIAPAPTPVAEVLTTDTYDMLISKLVTEVLQLFTWTNDDGTIAFTDTNYSAQYDCNTIFGTYEIDRSEVTFSTPASTKMACEEDAMDADQQLVEDLAAITQLTFKDGMLVMTGGASELTFAASLAVNDEAANEADTTNYVGMTVAEAEAAAEANDVAFRVGTIDGEAQAVTADYVIGRITAEAEDGVVVAFTVE